MKKILFFVFVLSSSSAFAESFVLVENLTVKGIYAGYPHKGAFVEFESGEYIDNPANCSITTPFVGIDATRSNVDHILSILMYAQATGKKVGLQIYSSSCFDNNRLMRRIKVE